MTPTAAAPCDAVLTLLAALAQNGVKMSPGEGREPAAEMRGQGAGSQCGSRKEHLLRTAFVSPETITVSAFQYLSDLKCLLGLP